MAILGANKRAALAFCALMALAGPARATAYSADYSDLWWNPTQSGWGIQFVQQANVIFATMYVYDAATNPVWYTATLDPIAANAFRGSLLATRGPWFGGPFDPNAVERRTVGTMTVEFPTLLRATLTYVVDGTTYVRNIERQTLRYEDFNGVFALWLRASPSGCTGVPAGEPLLAVVAAQLTQTPATFAAQMLIGWEDTLSTCTYSGSYSQSGHYGRSQGTYSCAGGVGTVGDSGTYTLEAMHVQKDTLTANIVQRGADGCTLTGVVGGIRGE